MFAGSYRRVPHHSVGRRPAGNRPLINFLFLLVALAIIYVCCVLVSLVRSQKRRHEISNSKSLPSLSRHLPRDEPNLIAKQYLTHLEQDEEPNEPDEPDIDQDTLQTDENQADDESDDSDEPVDNQYDDQQLEQLEEPNLELVPPDPTGPVPDKARKSLENPKGLPYPPEIIPPNRTRADTIQYGVCASSAYSVPGFGPLYLLDRGQESSCSIYLYPGEYGLSRPLLPKLQPRPTQQSTSVPASPPSTARRRLQRLMSPFNSARQLLGRPMAPRSRSRSARDDSHVAIGVLAAAMNFAAEEQVATVTDLQQIPGLRMPRSSSTLPPDIGHWTHVQLQKARALHAAWRANATDVEARLPHSAALLRHPTRIALAREFARASACLLQHQGGPGAAALRAAGDMDALADSVITWPQVMSYDTAERMPTGRETSLPGTLMRGVFIAREVGSVMIDTYDPRGPLDSMEIQDVVNDMYKIELRTGALLIFPSWIQTSILILPPERPSAGDTASQRPPPPNHVAQADLAALDLGFAAGFGAADAAPPPRSAAASILHLAIPGDPASTASAVLPLHMPNPRPPAAATRHLLGNAIPDAHPLTQTDLDATQNTDDSSREDGGSGGGGVDPGTCDMFEYVWYMYGSPVSVHNLEVVDPELDLVKLRELALAAFEAFRRCFPEDGNDVEHGYPGSLGDDLFAYQSHWPNTKDYPCAGGLEGAAAVEREEEWQRAFATYVMGAMHQRMLTAVSTVVTSLLRGLGKGKMVEQDPGMFSWLTVHDESTSFHGRHYHRDQGMTAVLYLSDPAPDTAPLEFSNPIVGPDTSPNGRVTFKPRRGDFVLFPSFLSHTVPMRHLQEDAPPRISIAFNIWFRGEGLNRYADGMTVEERDEVGHHQYVTMSDVVVDRRFKPGQGMPFAQPSLD